MNIGRFAHRMQGLVVRQTENLIPCLARCYLTNKGSNKAFSQPHFFWRNLRLWRVNASAVLFGLSQNVSVSVCMCVRFCIFYLCANIGFI
jgi:hypothetical protein